MPENNNKRKTTLLSKFLCFSMGSLYDIALSKFPNTVQIETTNACNAKCIICPHKTMQRTVKTMDDNLFVKVIDECAAFSCDSVHLHNFGEPLLDPQIYERIRYAKDCGLKRIKIFSNGSVINADVAEKLIKSGLDEIKISFDGANKEEFEEIRYPLKFDPIVNNIKLLVDMRNKLKSSMSIEIACCSTSDKNLTMSSLENCVDDFSFGKIHSWGDSEIPGSTIGVTRKPCSRIWRTFTVLSDGRSSLCCLDYDGKFILGDVNNSTIADIWKNSLYKRARKTHKRAKQDEIKICSRCSKSFL